MKYRVVGWVYYEDYSIPSSGGTIGFAETNAIIDDIRKHKYLFTGWDHQEAWENCVPVLNDGKKRMFSQRAWGGVMAEAYGHMGDYDYANYTFHESIKENYKKFPKSDFDYESFEVEEVENEHFTIEVKKELFEIAKTKNPFYLEDDSKLRYIDSLDTLTLTCEGKELNFLVEDIDRNKKEVKFSKHDLIKGKYKIIVKHRPMLKNKPKRSFVKIEKNKINETFISCLDNYDYSTMYYLFKEWNVEEITNKAKNKKVKETLKRFVLEYINDYYSYKVLLSIIRYINDFDFYKQVAYDHIKDCSDLLISFVNDYLNSDKDMDKHILKVASIIKKTQFNHALILKRAIELKPECKSYRKKYYSITSFSNGDGFVLMAGLEMFDSIHSEDKYLLNLDNYKKMNYREIFNIAKFMSYPNNDVSKDVKYSYNIPFFYKEKNDLYDKGIMKYQEYLRKNFDIDNKLEEILLYGIEKKCMNMEIQYNGYSDCADYIYGLDALSAFKYNFKNKVISEYGDDYPELVEELNKKYN